MASGIGFSEILLILAIMVIFIDSKQIPELIRKSFRIAGQLRAAIRKFIDEFDVK
jgi:Sec-independent protein translocase protein TatA